MAVPALVIDTEAILEIQQRMRMLEAELDELKKRLRFALGAGGGPMDYVKKTGDTMTGILTLPELVVDMPLGSSLTIEEKDIGGLRIPQITPLDETGTNQILFDSSTTDFYDTVTNHPVFAFYSNDFLSAASFDFDAGATLDFTIYSPNNIILSAGGDVVPVSDDSGDLGNATWEWKDGYFDGTLYVDTLSLDATAGLGCATDFNPTVDGSKDLGSATREWQDLFLDGTAAIDTLRVDVNLNLENLDVVCTLEDPTRSVPVTANSTTMYLRLYPNA